MKDQIIWWADLGGTAMPRQPVEEVVQAPKHSSEFQKSV